MSVPSGDEAADDPGPAVTGSRVGPPLGRHVAAIGVTVLAVWLFWRVQHEGGGIGRWNRAVADTSVMLLCFVLVLGPVARYQRMVRRLVPWRRELGIAMFVTAGLHVAILLDGGWNPFDFLFGEDFRGETELFRSTDAAANWVGLLALGYAMVLAATSNRLSQRLLGRGWKLLQQQAYTLFVLTVLHVAGWLYLVVEAPSRFARWFWIFVSLTVAAQFAGYVRRVRSSGVPVGDRRVRRLATRPRPGRVPTLRGATTLALWGLLIVGIYRLGVE